MHQERFSRHLLTAFLLSVVLYVTLYWFIEHRRVKHGPWRVAFATNTTGVIAVQIQQESLRLGPVTVRFSAEQPPGTNLWQNVAFAAPRPVPFDVPGGQCVFQDTTFLPGTVVLEVGATTLQMLPRVLSIGTNEFPWKAGTVIALDGRSAPRTVE